MTRYRFHWRDGSTSEGEGDTPAAALNKMGYGAGAIAMLDWFQTLDEEKQAQ